MNDISHRVRMPLGSYYVYCSKCPFADMKKACVRAQKLKKMPCYKWRKR